MRAHAWSIALAALAAVTMVAAILLAGCGAAPSTMTSPPVTGLVVTVNYEGEVATVELNGAAATGRRFGPWTLPTAKLASGGTVGFVFDPSDAGSALICAQSRNREGLTLDVQCQTFVVRADEVVNGALSLRDPIH
jgi:hypothetical protein